MTTKIYIVSILYGYVLSMYSTYVHLWCIYIYCISFPTFCIGVGIHCVLWSDIHIHISHYIETSYYFCYIYVYLLLNTIGVKALLSFSGRLAAWEFWNLKHAASCHRLSHLNHSPELHRNYTVQLRPTWRLYTEWLELKNNSFQNRNSGNSGESRLSPYSPVMLLISCCRHATGTSNLDWHPVNHDMALQILGSQANCHVCWSVYSFI